MAEVAFLYIDDIEGECNVAGHETAIEVRKFDHLVHVEVDPLDTSRATSARLHSPMSIITKVDKSFVGLNKALIEGKTIDVIRLELHRQPPEGSTFPELYFMMTFVYCIIIRVDPQVHDVTLDPSDHLVSFDFSYRQVEWEHPAQGVVFKDIIRE